MKKFFYYLPSIVFNVAEVLVVILIGKLLELPINSLVVILTLFVVTRMLMKKPLHYKKWYKCFIWTTLFFLSLFVVVKVSLIIAICLTIFEAMILTNKGNIKDIFMWGGNDLNKEVFNWVKFNQDNEKLIKYESRLKETDKQKYFIFIYRFREFKSYSQIAKLMDMDAQRISEEIKTMSHFIEYSIRLDS